MQSNIRKRISIILSILVTVLFIPTTSFASDVADTISYSVVSGNEVEFDGDDFNDACQDLMNEDLYYVEFDLPSSSKGVLYYDYDGDDEAEVDDDDAYYYDDDDDDLSDVSFLADDEYDGTVTISYTGYDEDGNEYSGNVKITVSEDNTDGDIQYSTDEGDEVNFDEDDFNDFCQDENDADLDYVTFEQPSSSKGTLYYDYDGDDEEELDENDEYYYDNDDEYSISDITFVPYDDYSGDCEIDFEGYDEDGNSIAGTVVVSVEEDDDAGSADMIYFSGTAGSQIVLIGSYFNAECEELTDNSLSYVKFTLPSSSYGTLYYGYTSASSYTSEVSTSTKYYYSQAPYLKNVSFVPAGDDAGTVTISYMAYDTSGTSYTGAIQVTFSASSSTSTNSTLTAEASSATAPAAAPATATSAKVVVDGRTVSFDAYNINGSNYFKLRDIAYAVSGTTKQFGVAYDSDKKAISLTANSVYVTVGGELASGDGNAKMATLTTSPIYKDGNLAGLGAYNINGNNYFKLRDLAKEFNIGVSWNAADNTVEINTANGYTE